MKTIKKLRIILLMAIIVLFPFIEAQAVRINVPISVEWYYGDDKWDDAYHRTDIKIEPLNGAPIPKEVENFSGEGDLRLEFAPDFTGPGKYEYLVYLANEDIVEENRQVIFDKTTYRLVYFVQYGPHGLEIAAYAYDNDKYINNPQEASKIAELKFKNNDPHKGKGDGSTTKPNDPNNPDDTNDPDKSNDSDGTKEPNKPNDPDKGGKDPNSGKDSQTKDPQVNPGNPTNGENGGTPGKNPDKNVFGENKKSHDNVQTGIESLTPWLLVLLVAIIAYRHTNNDIHKQDS